MNVVALTC